MSPSQRAAMQQALEALGIIVQWDESGYVQTDAQISAATKAITALRAALAEPEPQPVAWMDDFGNTFPLAANKGAGSWMDAHKRNWRPLYAASPQPVAPAGWRCVPVEATTDMRNAYHEVTEDDVTMKGAAGSRWAAMLAAAPTAPQPAKRERLTDEQIAAIYVAWDNRPGSSMADFARSIEQAHGITEGGNAANKGDSNG